MNTMVQDLRYGLRQLVKNPGFTAIAVITLALGIGINATMFSMVSGILLRRPPGREPERVAVVSGVDPASGFQPDNSTVSVPNYLAWRDANHVFSALAAADEYRSASLTSQRESESVRAAAVTANYFDVLGVSAQMGRTFASNEDQSGQDHVVILGHELWQRRFGGDPSIVGRTIRLNREDYSVVGVMPADFRLLGYMDEVWLPLTVSASDQTTAARKERGLYLFGRLKPGVTLAQANAEFSTLANRAAENFPDSDKGWGAKVRTLPEFLIYGFGIRGGLAVIMTTVGFVLMIACANVSGLLLARAVARRKEVAIRFSLGARRWRIVRQLLTEGLVIASLGGALGLLLAYRGIGVIRESMRFNDAFNAVDLSLDSNVILFSAGISLACALLCALAPALKASRGDVTTSLKEEGRSASAGRSHSRLRTVMVTAEIAMALFLLVGTGLLFVSIFRLGHQNLGFQSDHLLTAGIALDDARYKDVEQRQAFARDLLVKLRQIPGATSVALTSDLPVSGMGSAALKIQGQPDLPANQVLSAFDCVVTPDFFRAAGISVVAGRALSESDNAKAPSVVVVNQKFVDRYLNGHDAIGKRIRLEVNGAQAGWSEIVGVVNNTKRYPETVAEDPGVYEAFQQRPVGYFSLMVESAGDPDSLTSALRGAVSQMDTELPLARVVSMQTVLERTQAGDVFFSRTLASFAVLALLLAAIGIYGLLAYSVGQRTHEIGIRMAMGAKNQDVLRMIVREGMKMTAIGAAIGLAISLPLPKIFDAMFVDLNPREPRLFILVPAVILLVAAFATYIPARRAARMDPVKALRQE